MIGGGDNVFEEPVGTLVFIPEEGIGLRKFKGLDAKLFDDAVTHGIEAGEHPTATGAFLVGDVALLELHIKGGRGERCRLWIVRSGSDAAGTGRIACNDSSAVLRDAG